MARVMEQSDMQQHVRTLCVTYKRVGGEKRRIHLWGLNRISAGNDALLQLQFVGTLPDLLCEARLASFRM